jgi:hypothetical protein
MKNTGHRTTSASPFEELSGFLVTNQFPISREVYALRRSNGNPKDYEIWMKHLSEIQMHTVSPGFLFVQKKTTSSSALGLQHVVAPKSSYGSLWTPFNPEAVNFTASLLDRMYHKIVAH